ncbi:hypothetical protein GCM10008018_45210 [Paenibacillus marchantiophytorum]|uniref:Type I restriction modification DNA specificity domain-containing protein n=1 Tax=Paenibacillus marchantiophytorum TaxID=1619310 RepID=A0ABQ1EZ25_9BACL|nr:restriction endonuclease subunit S [Paenibacillus marchantiophytorum]GFZ93760.1 hypothetical protein GCM10008018_45210 [Paenibacillus marchantiophytorum]
MAYFFTVVPNIELNYRLDANYYTVDALEDEKKIKVLDFDYLDNRLISLASGATPSGAKYVDQGVVFIRTQNIQGNMINKADVKYITDEDNRVLKRSQLRKNDVLLTITGVDLGRSAVVSEELLPANINQHSVRLEIKNLDPYYVSTFFNSRYGQSQIWRRVYGATRPALNYDDIKDIMIPTPRFEIQKYIGNKIRKAEELREEGNRLMEKAEGILNNKIGTELYVTFESNASLFNWVDYTLINNTRIDADYFKKEYLEQHRYFFENKAKFERLNKISGLSKKRVNFSDYGECFKYLDISSLDEETGIFNENEVLVKEAPSRAQKMVQTNNVLVATVRPNRKGVGLVTREFDGQVSSTGFAVLSVEHFDTDPYYLYLLLRSDIVTNQLVRLTSGGLYPAINEDDLMNIYIPNVCQESQLEIGRSIKTYFENLNYAKKLISEAIQDIEYLIEGKLDESKISEER